MTGGNTPFSCATVSKKGRMRWTPELHKAFVAAVEALGPEAYPISVLESMGPCGAGLTRENIASHLQKYRHRIFNSAQRSPKRAAAAAAACNDASLPLRRHSAPDFGNCSQLCLADGQPLLSACGHRFATQSATAAEASTFATMGGAFGGLNSSNTHGGGFGNGGSGDDCFLLPDMTPEPLPHMPALEDLSCSDMDGSGIDGVAAISGLAAGSSSGNDCSSWMAQQLPPAVTAAAAVPPFATSSPNTVTSPCYWPAASAPFSAAAAADAPKPTCTSPATGFNGTIAADAAAPQPSVAWLSPQPPICIAQPQPATQAAAYDQMHAALLKALAAPSSLPGQSPLGLKLDKQAVLQELQASLVAA